MERWKTFWVFEVSMMDVENSADQNLWIGWSEMTAASIQNYTKYDSEMVAAWASGSSDLAVRHAWSCVESQPRWIIDRRE